MKKMNASMSRMYHNQTWMITSTTTSSRRNEPDILLLMKINFSQNGSNQAAQWAHKKQEMIEKAARLKEQRKQNLASSGERAISSSLGKKLFHILREQSNFVTNGGSSVLSSTAVAFPVSSSVRWR
jgi:hypothetical protein